MKLFGFRLAGVLILGYLWALGATGIAGDAAENAKQAQGVTQVQRQQDQPYNNAPTWRDVRSGDPARAITQVRGRETNVLINSSGESWRQFRNGPVTLVGGTLLVVVLAAILAFYSRKGTIQLHGQPTGRQIQRFALWQRWIHWTTAICFVTLGLTGLVIFFGKHVLIPVIGYGAFSWLAIVSKNLHNFVGPLFFVCAIVLFFTFVKRNDWHAYDTQWLRKGGGLTSGEEVPSGFFNAGEKLWFWGGLSFLGIIVSLSGFVLDFPNFDQTRSTMQIANLIHGIGALLFITGSFGHIYMGTLGMSGAFNAMKTGHVDEQWAKEHHEYWYQDIKSGKGSAPESEPGGANAQVQH